MLNTRFYVFFTVMIVPTCLLFSADGVPCLVGDDLSFIERLAMSRMQTGSALEAPKLTFAEQMAARKAVAAQKDTSAAASLTPQPVKKLTFAEQMAARKAAATQRLAGDADARQVVLVGVAGKKTLEEFAAEAGPDGKVGTHFVVPHAGRALINTATHKAIPLAHESFDPTAGTHLTRGAADALVLAETREKELAEANCAKAQTLLATVKADFGGAVAGAMDGVLTPLCAALKVGTNVEATADAALVATLVAADQDADALVAKFLAAHGAIAENSPQAKKVQTLVDLIKFFIA